MARLLMEDAEGFHRAGRRYRSTPCPKQDPLRALTDPTVLIGAAACFSAVEDMAETLGDPYFAARVAIETAKTGSPGIREAASHAVNLGDFLSRVVVEVSKQVDKVVHSVTVLPGVVSVETRRTVNVSGPTTQVDAIGPAFYVTVIKQGIGDVFDPRRALMV